MNNGLEKIRCRGLNPSTYTLITALLLLISVGITGCGTSTAKIEDVPLVRAQTVTAGTAGQIDKYSGEVRGRFESQLAFQVGGRITARNVELGSRVQPGDILMRIDAKDLRQGLISREAQVDSAAAELNLAEENLKRYQELYSQAAISKAQLDQYKSARDTAAARLRQVKAQYQEGINQYHYSELRADQAGVVAEIAAEIGQVVSAGQTIVTIVQDSELEVEIHVPENRIRELPQDQKVRVGFWAMPGVAVEGRVREVAPAADKVTRTYKVRVGLVNPPQDLKSGMTATVMIAPARETQMVQIPFSAIYQPGSTPSVWLITGDVVKLQPIELAAVLDGKVEVVEGLKPGDLVVTAGVQKLREGQQVRVNKNGKGDQQ